MPMETNLIVGIVAAISSLAVAGISFYLAKAKDREADWRKFKFEQYSRFVASLSGAVDGGTLEGRQIFAKECNSLHLIGSPKVLEFLHQFQDEIMDPNQNLSKQLHDELLRKLILAIRADLGISKPRVPEKFQVHLTSSGSKYGQQQSKL